MRRSIHLLVCYDVVDDRRRAKLSKYLKSRLERVQKSVFEGHVPESTIVGLMRRIGKLIDREADTVRIYQLCARCRDAVEVLGWGVPVEPDDDDIIV